MHKILIKIVDTLILNYYYLSITYLIYADVAELADAPDLGSGAYGVGVRLPSSAPLKSTKNVLTKQSMRFFVIEFKIA